MAERIGRARNIPKIPLRFCFSPSAGFRSMRVVAAVAASVGPQQAVKLIEQRSEIGDGKGSLMAEPEEREVYFEFIAVGNAMKATVIDSLTGIEISTMGSRGAGRPQSIGLAEAQGQAEARRKNQYIAGCVRRPSKPWRVGADMVGQAIPGETNGRDQ